MELNLENQVIVANLHFTGADGTEINYKVSGKLEKKDGKIVLSIEDRERFEENLRELIEAHGGFRIV